MWSLCISTWGVVEYYTGGRREYRDEGNLRGVHCVIRPCNINVIARHSSQSALSSKFLKASKLAFLKFHINLVYDIGFFTQNKQCTRMVQWSFLDTGGKISVFFKRVVYIIFYYFFKGNLSVSW